MELQLYFETESTDALRHICHVLLWCRVILTQPITALAFVWDGVLFGVSGFEYASKAMVACAVPSIGVMSLAMYAQPSINSQLGFVWAGLGLIMALRAAFIYLPFKLKRAPFDRLFTWEMCQVNRYKGVWTAKYCTIELKASYMNCLITCLFFMCNETALQLNVNVLKVLWIREDEGQTSTWYVLPQSVLWTSVVYNFSHKQIFNVMRWCAFVAESSYKWDTIWA